MNADRKYFDQRLQSLQSERSSWEAVWRRVSENIQPVRGRFIPAESSSQSGPAGSGISATTQSRGQDRHNHLLDDTATDASDTLASGMLAGISSPARPWFRLAVPDPALDARQEVKEWTTQVRKILLAIFARSNVYRGLHTIYEELGLFGTSASMVMDDRESLVRLHQFTAGEYFLAQNAEQRIDTLYRMFTMTATQMVAMFGIDNCSRSVQMAAERAASKDRSFVVIHAVEPRQTRDPRKRDGMNMPWRSVYFEYGNSDGKFLREWGFAQPRMLTPRWAVNSSDVYGRGPGHRAVGAAEDLQRAHVMKGKARDYKADPPIQVPASMRGSADVLPGGVSYYNGDLGPGGGIRTAYEVTLDTSDLMADIVDMRQRIQSAFFTDLFRMISNLDTVRTATEIVARQEEKMLLLGPVLERLHTELLDPLIDTAFYRALEVGMLPPPPPVLQGQPLKVEYISMLAQAQKAVGLGAVDRLLGVVGSVAQFRPDAVDKISSDELIDGYADMLGVDPNFIVANKEVAIIRDQRQQAAAEQMQREQAPAQAQAIKTLSETDPMALQDLATQASGL